MYNLYAVTKPKTLDKVPSNTCGLATSMLIAAIATAPSLALFCASTNIWSYAYNAASCSCCCCIIACNSKLCQLIVYGDSGSEGNGGSGIGGGDYCSESTDSMLNSLPDSYSELNIFLCKS